LLNITNWGIPVNWFVGVLY